MDIADIVSTYSFCEFGVALLAFCLDLHAEINGNGWVFPGREFQRSLISFEITNKNKRMLKAHAEMYTLSGSFDGIKPPRKPFSGASPGFDTGFAETPMFRLSTFYTVALSYDGDILEIENEPPTVFT
ncbi:MAG: hypothetical protein K2P41_02720, partial [Lachnospiraceae bacterium]|nr:hypothetical protein [Lachnospiraceae bacterium]